MNVERTFLAVFASAALSLTMAGNANADTSYGFSVRMSGWPNSTADYAFAFPAFTFTNLSSPGIAITSIAMDDGSASGLWDFVSYETASAGVGYTLTQGDYVNDSGWSQTVAYGTSGFGAGGFLQFYLDPDTIHGGTGNVVDARSYVFDGGTATAEFSNGESMTLTWNNPSYVSFDPLRLPNQPGNDDRNIYYELSNTVLVTNPVPEPETYAMMLAGLGLLGAIARRRKTSQIV